MVLQPLMPCRLCALISCSIEYQPLLYAAAGVEQASANFQWVPLPGEMFGEETGGSPAPAPRWANLCPEAGALEPGEALTTELRLWVDGGRNGTAEALATAPVLHAHLLENLLSCQI